MKVKYLIFILSILFLVSCVPQQLIKKNTDPVIVKLKIEGVDKVKVEESNKVTKAMEVPYDGGKFGNTIIEDGKAYMTVGYSISQLTSQELWTDLQLLKSRGIHHIKLYLSSGGGSAFAGLAMSDNIETAQREGFDFEVHASGIIASATVPIFAVCNKRYATSSTIFMVHEAAMFKFGTESKSDIKSQNKLMDLLTNKYYEKLSRRSNISIDQWLQYERDCTWFSAQTAKEWGLVDEIE